MATSANKVNSSVVVLVNILPLIEEVPTQYLTLSESSRARLTPRVAVHCVRIWMMSAWPISGTEGDGVRILEMYFGAKVTIISNSY